MTGLAQEPASAAQVRASRAVARERIHGALQIAVLNHGKDQRAHRGGSNGVLRPILRPASPCLQAQVDLGDQFAIGFFGQQIYEIPLISLKLIMYDFRKKIAPKDLEARIGSKNSVSKMASIFLDGIERCDQAIQTGDDQNAIAISQPSPSADELFL